MAARLKKRAHEYASRGIDIDSSLFRMTMQELTKGLTPEDCDRQMGEEEAQAVMDAAVGAMKQKVSTVVLEPFRIML